MSTETNNVRRETEMARRNSTRARMKRQIERERRRRMRRLLLTFLCLAAFFIILLAFVIIKSTSQKESLRNDGMKYFKAGNYESALSSFQQSLKEKQWFSDDMDSDTELYVAECYMKLGQYQKALSQYMAIKSSKKNYIKSDLLDTYINVADVLYKVENGKDYKTYLESLQKEAERGSTSIYLYIGACYQKMGQYENMISAYQKYLSAFPMNTYVAYQLSTYYLKVNDLANAESYIQQGKSAGDDMFLDLLSYNEVVLTEKKCDYDTAYQMAVDLAKKYPGNDTFQQEADILYTRINIDTVPVHSESDAE